MKKHIFITGCSTGIGFATVKSLVNAGYSVHATVRSEKDKHDLLSLSPTVNVYLMDVTEPESVNDAITELAAKLAGQPLYGLINNAGIAVAGPMEMIPMDDFQFQFEVNVFGTLRVTQAIIPLLDENNSYVISISSKAALISLPFTGAYSASKKALEGYTDTMRREMIQTGIKFVLIEPGAVKTPIWDKAEEIDLDPYEGTRYEPIMERVKHAAVSGGKNGAEVEKLAELITSILSKKNPKTRYIFSKSPLIEIRIPKWMSDKRLDKLVKKKLWS
jgi:hypothetical protein